MRAINTTVASEQWSPVWCRKFGTSINFYQSAENTWLQAFTFGRILVRLQMDRQEGIEALRQLYVAHPISKKRRCRIRHVRGRTIYNKHFRLFLNPNVHFDLIIRQLFLVLKLEIETTGPQHTWRQAHFAWTQTGEFNLQQNCNYFSKANVLTTFEVWSLGCNAVLRPI